MGGPSLIHASATRASRVSHENIDDTYGTDGINAARRYFEFCEKHLAFLRGNSHSPHGLPRLRQKLCMQAVCCTFVCSLNFFYKCRKPSTRLLMMLLFLTRFSSSWATMVTLFRPCTRPMNTIPSLSMATRSSLPGKPRSVRSSTLLTDTVSSCRAMRLAPWKGLLVLVN